jgi:hypothetical protein
MTYDLSRRYKFGVECLLYDLCGLTIDPTKKGHFELTLKVVAEASPTNFAFSLPTAEG